MEIPTFKREFIDRAIKKVNHSFYFYDLDQLKLQLNNWQKILPDDITLWYACKANPLSAVLKVFRNHGFGIDVASLGELDQAMASGVKPENILATGPAKSKEYLRSMIDNEVGMIILESTSQAKWLNEAAAEASKKIKALIRVQLEWTEGESVLGGKDITPFGEDESTWRTFNWRELEHLDILGIHVFQWGNILDLSQLKSLWNEMATRCVQLANDMQLPLKLLDLGGGLGIPYEENQKPISFYDVAKELFQLKKKFQLENIYMELGRFAIGPYGHYLTRVIDRKTVRGKELLVLEGGINHMVRPAITKQPFPSELYRQTDAPLSTFQVHGPLCTALDKFGDYQLPNDIAPGDWMIFHQTGAYGFTESMPFFLCHSLPAEVILYNDDLMIPRWPRPSIDWLV